MVVGITPFRVRKKDTESGHHDEMITFENIIDSKLRFPDDMERDCADLIDGLLTKKPAMRMGCGNRTYNEFQEHDWFDGAVDWCSLESKQIRPPWVPILDDQTDKHLFENKSCYQLY
mmetsp:Transcript_8531/g.10182  ORF Transcript_8531/g.10182 Transcript_8531/m.10182 type:complete len:117 (-) Transcript_8531:66-416(-)